MRQSQLPHSELTVSALCYGAASFGTGVQGAAMDRLFGLFREAGGNFFDTAHCYCFWIDGGLGVSERALGDCLRRHGGRDEVVIATKGGHPAVGTAYPRPDDYLAPRVIAGDIDDSLARLGVTAIDLYFLHRDDPRLPAGEIIETLNAEIKRGGIRYLGASNWTAARLAAANAYAAAHGLHGFVASQPQWNLAAPNLPLADLTMRFLTAEDRQWHAESGLPVTPYSSTACGYFATGGQAGGFDNPTSRARLARAQQLAAELGSTPNQVALAYLLHQPFPVHPILGTTNPDHLADALCAPALSLTREQVGWLEGQ